MKRAEAGEAGSWPGALGPEEPGGLPWFHDQVVPAGSSSSRVIVHVDLDCFYAQVEMISNPELKSKPLGVQQKYLVVTCNYEARKLGVKKLMNVRDAKEKCPQLVLVNGEDLTRYREMSYKVTGIGYKTTKRLEALGISSVRDLQTFSSKILEKELGISVAQRIQKLSFGEDNSPVTPSGPPQSFSEEDSFKKCSSEVEAKNKIEELLASLLNRVCQDGRKPHTIRLIIRRYSSEKHYSRESRQCPIPSHIIQKLGIGNYDVMTPMVDVLMKLFRNMVNVKMPFHLTLLSVCFCNLKALNTAKKGTIDYYLTPSLSTTSRSGKHSFKMKDTHMEDFSKDKETNWDFLPTGRIESTRTGESPPDTTSFSKEKDSNEFPLSSLPEGIDQEVFKQLPVEIQEEILSGKSREKVQGKGSLSCPLHASRGVLSFFSTKQMQDGSLKTRDHLSNTKQISSVSPCEPGTSGLNSSSSSYVSNQKDYSHYMDSSLKDELMSQGPKESQGFHFSKTDPAVSVFHSFPNLKSEQLFSKNFTTDNHKQPMATVFIHEGLTENREQDSTEEKITFPSDVDPEVFYELPEEVQKELLAGWKRTGSDFHTVFEPREAASGPDIYHKVLDLKSDTVIV
ncbi:DNA polymerase iota isoform X7 [Physeter macrocephalus]|uniref:DNA polymerase iota isoform X7 n=1 Tax=Physeter macrocephalus TaxID=9755 RepID=A0A455AKT8_PHYMC|nr:DNA polymerase iota isoform X7 [Physeter catodon]|eukprot:XP_028336489.1 DNA polymerase iota isoform X7 [Physeter catodon]